MFKIMSPTLFLAGQDKKLEEAIQKVVKFARQSTKKTFNLSMRVETSIRKELKDKLISLGFSGVTFHSEQRDGEWLEIRGNPFADANIEKEAKLYSEKINTLLLKAKMYNGKVQLNIAVPEASQSLIRRSCLSAGWTRIEFESDQREGSWMTLYA